VYGWVQRCRVSIGTVCADKWLMRFRISHRRALLVALLLGYLPLAGGYLLLVAHKSGVLQTKRQQLIDESPLVWVAPFGVHYHQKNHYSRHLSSPISLYEATERGYQYCDICHPPHPAQLLHSPAWVRHWLPILFTASCSWLILIFVVAYKIRNSIQQALPADST
jgi:hypothetical protein